MRIESLQYFVATTDCKSMTLASTMLHVSQQNISKEIKSLEEELNTQLFVRSKQGVALTETGVQFYKAAIEILQKISAFYEISQDKHSLYSIALYGAFLEHLESIMHIFLTTHSPLSLNKFYLSIEQVYLALSNTDTDLALFQIEKHSLNHLVQLKNYAHILLIEEPAQILVNSTISSSSKEFPLKTLKDYPICAFSNSMQEIALYERIAKQYGALTVMYKGNSNEQLHKFFKEHNCVSLLTKSICTFISDRGMTLMPIDEHIPICTILSVKKDLLEHPEIEDFINITKNFFQQFI